MSKCKITDPKTWYLDSLGENHTGPRSNSEICLILPNDGSFNELMDAVIEYREKHDKPDYKIQTRLCGRDNWEDWEDIFGTIEEAMMRAEELRSAALEDGFGESYRVISVETGMVVD